MRFVSMAAAGIAFAGVASAAVAQDISTVPEPLLGMVGDWRLEQEDQSLPTCALTFTEEQTDAGWLIHLPEPCPLPFPSANALVAWNVDADGAVIITDSAGNEVLHLIEGDNGLYMTEPGALPAFYLMLPYDAEGMGGEAGDAVE